MLTPILWSWARSRRLTSFTADELNDPLNKQTQDEEKAAYDTYQANGKSRETRHTCDESESVLCILRLLTTPSNNINLVKQNTKADGGLHRGFFLSPQSHPTSENPAAYTPVPKFSRLNRERLCCG